MWAWISHSCGRQLALSLVIIGTHANAEDFVLKRPESPAVARPEILGGHLAIPENWPATFVFVAQGERCTATAIGPLVVLTAGHCIAGTRSGRIQDSKITLSCVPHHHYNWTGAAHDLALCRASAEIVLKNGAPFESLGVDTTALQRDRQLLLVGYGCSDVGPASDAIFEGNAAVSVLPQTDQPSFVTQGASVCFGDSGGGAYAIDNAGRRTIVGVASKSLGDDSSIFSVIPLATTREFIHKWRGHQKDPDTGAHIEVKICGIDESLHNCNR